MSGPTTLHECLYNAKQAAKDAAAFAEATDLFLHHATVARRFAARATQAAHQATGAAKAAATLATNACKGRPRVETEQVQQMATRIQAYAALAAEAAAQAEASARAAHRFTSATGDLAALERARQAAYYAWVTCPDPEGSLRLDVLRVRVEEAEAAIQAAQQRAEATHQQAQAVSVLAAGGMR